MRYLALIPLIPILLLNMGSSSCNEKTTDQVQSRRTEQMVAEAERLMGPPDITNFTERRFAKMIYELRDQEVATYSYFMDMNGNLHFLCESIGYGLPYSVQYVNPDRPLHPTWRDSAVISQPEPNGLFMPDGLSATWVLCSDGKGGVRPVYSEPNLIVSPFKLESKTALRK